jgi:hypothetical protein
VQLRQTGKCHLFIHANNVWIVSRLEDSGAGGSEVILLHLAECDSIPMVCKERNSNYLVFKSKTIFRT